MPSPDSRSHQRQPTGAQQLLVELPPCDVLVLAAAGCGKTEALAMRAAGLVARRHVRSPRRILAVTFSNKAKRNLQDRLSIHVGTAAMRRYITVHNFHGLAARLVEAHGYSIDMPDEMQRPERSWQSRVLEDLDVPWQQRAAALEIVRTAKQQNVEDDDVWAEIQKSGNAIAIALEERLLAENRQDFDDLIRRAVRVLRVDAVSALYRAHFAAVLVDEMQDMTMHQLEMIDRIGLGRTTFAGDPSQGIFAFAGAQPVEIVESIAEREPEVVVLTESFRSAPAVLEVVNVLAAQMGGQAVTCAEPDRWEGAGCVMVRRFENPAEEADDVLDLVESVLSADQSASIAVIVRVASRKRAVEQRALERGLDCERWDNALQSQDIRELLVRVLPSLRATAPDEFIDELRDACVAQVDPMDIDTTDQIFAAVDVLRQEAAAGTEPRSALVSLLARRPQPVAVSPGLHFLNAHVGKGQQFDWVVVLGMEQDFIPSHLATTDDELAEEFRILHVISSRARVGLLFTCCHDVRSSPRRPWIREESPWLRLVETCVTESRSDYG